MRNSPFRDSESAFGPGFPLGLRRLASTPWPAPPAPPEPEGVEGERSADPSSGRPRRRIISAFAAMRAARRRSYGVSPCMRARARSRRGGQRVSRPHASRRARSKREESKSIRGGGTGREEARRAVRAGEARGRTSSGSPASAIAALALVRGWSRGGSTCACALGSGAGEQPEEYRIFSRKTKLSHHTRQLCSKPVAARVRAGAARVRARDPAREGSQRAVSAPRSRHEGSRA